MEGSCEADGIEGVAVVLGVEVVGVSGAELDAVSVCSSSFTRSFPSLRSCSISGGS